MRRRPGLEILQWNCDYLPTKIGELASLVDRRQPDILAIQETKLGEADKTPLLPGYNAVRQDRPGSGTASTRGGGLIFYLKAGLPYAIMDPPTTAPFESQEIRIPVSRAESISVLNVYVPPATSATPVSLASLTTGLEALNRTGHQIICGDFNGHHPQWDLVVAEDPRGAAILDWMVRSGHLPLNDGGPTRYARYAQGATGSSSPDLTIAHLEDADELQWERLNDLGSDHLPILIRWRRPVKVEPMGRKVRLNLKKTDWKAFYTEMEARAAHIEGKDTPEEKLCELTEAILSATRDATPKEVLRDRHVPWMTKEIKEAQKERNRLRRNLTNATREDWCDANRRVLQLIQEAKRRVWEKNLAKVENSKDPGMVWRVVNSLDGSHQPCGKDKVLKSTDFTSASLSKKCSPRGRDPAHCEGKVLKSVFVPNIGWASQVCGAPHRLSLSCKWGSSSDD
jgi:hypothetical protein